MRYYTLVLIVAIISLGSCGKQKTKKQAKIDEEIIQDYISDHNIQATATGSGLYYVIDSLTNGDYPSASGSVTVAYKGYFTDGSVFDQSPGSGSNFSLSSVIRGWQEGIPLFPEGSRGKLFVPSHLGYGLKDYGDIPGGSVLIFDIHVIDVP